MRQSSKHILVLNWRDITHPKGGGAEKLTHEIVVRWVAQGHSVTLFAAMYPGAQPEEVINGVHVVRRGHQHTVHWEAYKYYRQQPPHAFDVIVDEVNTIPFFTPLYAHEPVIMFINQLAREVWRFESSFPISTLGYAIEPYYLKVYKRTRLMTISQSTKDDLRHLGLTGPCTILPMAVDTPVLTTLPLLSTKEEALTLIFVGRVVRSKRVDHIIRALACIRAQDVDARLWIVGGWDTTYKAQLDALLATLGNGCDAAVTFYGRVDVPTKESLLSRSHFVVLASIREGWGLVVTEANQVGTISVVYDAPGLRDSTIDGETGVVCRHNTPEDLATSIVDVHNDATLYAALRERAWDNAKALSWDRTASAAWAVVEEALRQ